MHFYKTFEGLHFSILRWSQLYWVAKLYRGGQNWKFQLFHYSKCLAFEGQLWPKVSLRPGLHLGGSHLFQITVVLLLRKLLSESPTFIKQKPPIPHKSDVFGIWRVTLLTMVDIVGAISALLQPDNPGLNLHLGQLQYGWASKWKSKKSEAKAQKIGIICNNGLILSVCILRKYPLLIYFVTDVPKWKAIFWSYQLLSIKYWSYRSL